MDEEEVTVRGRRDGMAGQVHMKISGGGSRPQEMGFH